MAAKTRNASPYNPVTPDIVGELRGIVGDRNVIVDEEKLETYSHDETNADEYGHMPEVVVPPNNPDEGGATYRARTQHFLKP